MSRLFPIHLLDLDDLLLDFCLDFLLLATGNNKLKHEQPPVSFTHPDNFDMGPHPTLQQGFRAAVARSRSI